MNLIRRDLFKGQRIFILGAGPSLRNTNLELLKNDRVIMMNQAACVWRGYPNVPEFKGFNVHTFKDYYFAISDMLNIRQHYQRGLYKQRDNIMRTIIAPPNASTYKEFTNRVKFDMTYHKPEQFPIPFSDDVVKDGIFWWGNVLLELVFPVCMYWGCTDMYLLGCDSTNKSHFYNVNDPVGPNNMENIVLRHRMIAPMLKQKGFNVYDATINGKLDAYPKVKLEEII